MTRTKHLTGALLCAMAGLAAGWAIHGGAGRIDAPDTGPGTKSDRRSGGSMRPDPPAGVASRVGRVGRMKDTGKRMKAAYAMAMGVPLDRIEEWLDGDYFDTPDSRVDNFFYQILYDRWLDADPEAFLTRCLHKNYDSVLTTRYMKEWARRDPGATRDFMMGLNDRKDLDQVAGLVLGEMAKTDREGAITLIGELVRARGLDDYRFSDAIGTLAENDPDGLLQASADWPPSLGQMVLGKVSSAKLKQDFLGAVEWMQGYPNNQGQNLFRAGINNNRKLATEFFKFADRLPEGWVRSVINHDSWSLAYADPAASLALDPERLGMKADSLRHLRSNALNQIADKDWDKGAAMLDGDPSLSDAERRTLTENLASELSSRSLVEAKAWAAALTDPSLRKAAESRVMAHEKTGSSPGNITPGSLVSDALKENGSSSAYGTQYWTRHESAQAIDAFQELDAADRTKAAKRLLTSRSYLPLDLQAALISHQFDFPAPPEATTPDPNRDPFARDRPQQVAALAQQWAAWEPAEAARWIRTLPPGPERDAASKHILNSWQLQAPAEAERWLNRLPDDAGWDTLRDQKPEE